MTTPEGKVKDKLKKRLKLALGLDVWTFMPVQTGFGEPALDFLLCAYGFFVVVETKAAGKTLSARQEITKARIERAGGTVFVVDGDESIEKVIKFLLSLGKAVIGVHISGGKK